MTIVARLQRHAHRQPHAVAFRFLRDGEHESDRLTFAELNHRAESIAERLQALGAAGRRVLLLLPQDLRFVSAFFGCLYAAAVAVPVLVPRPRRPLPALQAIIRDCHPGFVLVTQEIRDYLQPALSAEFPEVIWQCVEDIGTPESTQEWAVAGESLALLQYTSGSTGTPKGVRVSHGNLAHNIETIGKAFGVSEDTVAGGWLPLYHDMGLIGLTLAPAYLGVPSVLMPPVAFLQQPERWLRMISAQGVTVSGAPNFAYDLCVDRIKEPHATGFDLSRWRVAFNGSEPVRARTMERFRGTFAACGLRAGSMYACYGMAEATLFVSGAPCEDEAATLNVDRGELRRGRIVPPEQAESEMRLVSCGSVGREMRVVIVDPETRLPVPDRRVGEIWIAGASVASGYFGSSGSADTFDAYIPGSPAGPFFRTGDLGFLNDGALYITGRLKDVIIVRGRNHYPQDLEETAEQSTMHLQRGAGAAFSLDVRGEEKLVLVHELKRSSLQADHVRVALDIQEAVIARHGLSAHTILLTKPGMVPKTSSGKLRRSVCRELFVQDELQPVYRYVQPG